jgi:hypothetical protein
MMSEMSAELRRPFDRPALFISSLSPGYIAGGSQCTLAFLQAVSELHGGRVEYLGPPWLPCETGYDVEVAAVHEVGDRSALAKAWHLLRGDSIDRVSPHVRAFMAARAGSQAVAYFNGDSVGAAVNEASGLGHATVFIPHNFTPAYLAAQGDAQGIVEPRRRDIAARSAVDGFGHSRARVCLTLEDRDRFVEATRRPELSGSCIAPCYFAYKRKNVASVRTLVDETVGPSVLINTNLAVPANIEGIVFFVREVLPRLTREVPGLRVIIAGRAPPRPIYDLLKLSPALEVHARPEPAAMDRLFGSASVCLAIAYRGSGIKLRVAEALRNGVPVVSTRHCAVGYESVSGGVLRIGDTAEEIAKGITEFLAADRREVAELCKSEHERCFGFDVGVAKLRGLEHLLGAQV